MVCTFQKATFERKEKLFTGWVSIKLTGTVSWKIINKVSNKLKINKLVKAEITRQEFVHWGKIYMKVFFDYEQMICIITWVENIQDFETKQNVEKTSYEILKTALSTTKSN
jgi:hypothetical protein